jgi:hypothetical protein
VADSAASSSLFIDLGPEGEVKYSCSVYYVRLDTIALGIERMNEPR